MASSRAHVRYECRSCGGRVKVSQSKVCPECGGQIARIRKQNDKRSGTASNEVLWPWTNYMDGLGAIILVGMLTLFSLGLAWTAINDVRWGVRLFCGMVAMPPWLVIYPLLISAWNRTRVTLDGSILRFQHEPWPWIPWPSIHLPQAQTVTIRKKLFGRRVSRSGAKHTFHYSVVAQFANGNWKTIATCHQRKHAEQICRLVLQCEHISQGDEQVSAEAIAPGVRTVDLDILDDSGRIAEWNVQVRGQDWTAERAWYSPGLASFLLIVCVAMLTGGAWLVILKPQDLGLPGWVALGVAAMVPLTGIYCGLALLFNKSEIRVEQGMLKQHHYPIPWNSAPPIEFKEIVDFKIQRKIRSRSRNNRLRHNETIIYDYLLLVVLRDGSKVQFEKSHQAEGIAALQKLLRRMQTATV